MKLSNAWKEIATSRSHKDVYIIRNLFNISEILHDLLTVSRNLLPSFTTTAGAYHKQPTQVSCHFQVRFVWRAFEVLSEAFADMNDLAIQRSYFTRYTLNYSQFVSIRLHVGTRSKHKVGTYILVQKAFSLPSSILY